jgi:pimeloyl-ACP methyl ester carboxylesterase
MRTRIPLLLLTLGFLAGVGTPAHGQAAASPPDDPERQKLQKAFDWLRERQKRDYGITSPDGIDEGRYVTLGGIEQWITIRGEDRRNPVLLFLHGGPGDATNPWSYAAFRTWLQHFTIVQWDQRGTGRTLGRNGPSIASTITIERMAQDGVELAEHLRKTLQVDKIVLVGHSWGSTLGIFIAKARPDLFYALVGTGQVADQSRNYTVAYAALLAHAERIGDARAIRELKEIGPPPYADRRGFGVQRKWSNLFEGADAFVASMVGLALTAPGYSARDINDWFDGQNVTAERLVPTTSALPASALRGDLALPLVVIQGKDDFTTPTSLARELVESIRAPRKAFVEIDGGHFAVFMKSDLFLRELIARVLPLTK